MVTVSPLLAGILQSGSDNIVPVIASAHLARISHHLRGPLNAMVGHARIQAQLESSQSGDNASQSSTRSILKSALSLTASFETIMDYAWLQLGAYPLAFRSLDPTEIVAATVSLAADLLDGKPVRFNTIVAPDLPPVCADVRAVRHILHNLIGNAIRFTERGEITLGLRPTTGGVHFDLQDTGRGLTPEQTAQVFSAFNNLDEGGLGLGLYVTRQLLVRHGTALTVSGQPGQGARFGFTLKAANRGQQAAGRPLLWILLDAVEAAWWSDLLTREYGFVISDGQSLRSNYTALSPDAILIDLIARGASRQTLIDLAMLECAAPIAVIASGTLLANEYRELGATAIGESPLSLIEALLDRPKTY